MKRDRRHRLLWELIDQMFIMVEYWDERDSLSGNISDDEFDYLIKTISAFAKKVNVTNHTSIV